MSSLRRLVVADRERRYLLTLPAVPANAPLVIALHGSNQTPETLRRFAGPSFDSLAVDHGFVVAYPEGYKKHWNDARTTAGFAARAEGYDDVLFVRTLIDALAAEPGIDRSQVYLIGYSNGGQLAIRAAHEAGQLFAGIMLISATQPAPEIFAPSGDSHAAFPVLIVHGTKDPNVPYQGGPASLFGFRPRGLGLSALDTAAYWADRNGITTSPIVTPLTPRESDGTRVERSDFLDGIHSPVRLITIEGGGHVIPGTKRAPRIMGRTSRQITAVDEFLAFFGGGR
ncbi:alpha/beta hydrolase family esterase [Micromonospora sp. NPDC003197]